MLKTISEALENFCIHQIRLPYTISAEISDKESLITYIDIDTMAGDKYRVYIASEENFMQRISKIFLEEDKSDLETLIDMSLETTNLVVGSAKVIAEEADENPYVINTPHFIKVGIFDLDYDQAKLLKIQDDEIIIAIKGLN
ncbi:MAG: chemotaxis protein CheX [Campylobacterota bacterium]|nr:chemotaxis protein CheX [Campylobacterota bacterium]